MATPLQRRWPEIRALFEAAIDRPSPEREAHVVAGAGADAELRDAVLGLLRREAAVDDARPLRAEADDERGAADPSHPRIADYRLLRVLGRGGMGVVWLAEQAQPRRLVALKLISGEPDAQSRARFEREAASLARLAHPGIAQIIEVGRTEDDRPFLVMEYVEGQPLSTAAAALGRQARLELLARIAEAVDHAHSRGVVHRDLKPSNILITADGRPKVLDFGIATLAGAAGLESLTATGMFLGTPAYMSPELAAGQPDVDARSDVYTLGVLGYELSCNRLPVSVAGLTPLEAVVAMQTQTPPRMSRIDLSLKGDLETVIGKAMAREPSERYPNAGAFADDLWRFLGNEPVRARTPSPWHRLRLFGRRNPALLALSLGCVVLLVGGLALSWWFALGESRERARVETALAQSEHTLGALQRLFSAGNPALAGQPDVSFRRVLNSGMRQLEGTPVDVRARVGYALAEALASLGEAEQAQADYRVVEALAREAGDDPLRLRAALRRIDLMLDRDDPRKVNAAIAELMQDPSIQADPLAHAMLKVQAAGSALRDGHVVSARRLLQEVQDSWPRSVSAADQRWAAEMEAVSTALHIALYRAAVEDDAALAALAARGRDALARLTPILGAEHPRIIRLRIYSEAMSEDAARTSHWLEALNGDLDRLIPELGITHPAILVRIESGLIGEAAWDASGYRRLIVQGLRVLRAQPLGSRWRLRAAVTISSEGFARGLEESMTVAEWRELRQAQCPASLPLERYCVAVVGALARTLSEQGEDAEALDELTALRRRMDSRTDPSIRYLVSRWNASALRTMGRVDEAGDFVDAAIAATIDNPELPTEEITVEIFSASWDYRPAHCARALAVLRPRMAALRQTQWIPVDVLARLLSTCEVRAGEDPVVALARLDAIWAKVVGQPQDAMVRLELVLAYLEIHYVLDRSGEFRRWALELQRLENAGVPLRSLLTGQHPWVEKARATYATLPAST